MHIFLSIVLSYGIETVTSNVNVTLNSSVVIEKCGANFCGVSSVKDENPNLQSPPIEQIYLISGIYLGCMILACLIIAFGVDSLSRYNSAFISRSSIKRTKIFYLHNKNYRGDLYVYCIKVSWCYNSYFIDTIEAEPARWKERLDLNYWPWH